MTKLVGPWTQTFTGKKFDLLAPSVDMVDWYDVAHALARINRYTGHASVEFSVGQHSCLVHDILMNQNHPHEVCLVGLLHDTPEYVTGDLSTPMKSAMQIICPDARDAFRFITDRAEEVLFRSLNVSWPVASDIKDAVKDADVKALVTEKKHFMSKSPEPWGEPFDSTRPFPVKLKPWKPKRTAGEFLSRLWTGVGFCGDEDAKNRVADALVTAGWVTAKPSWV